MRIGIISGCKREIKYAVLKKIRLIEYEEFIVAELPYSHEKIQRMRAKKVERVLKKAENFLKNNGAEKVIVVDGLRGRCFDEKEIFYQYAASAALASAKYFDIEPPLKLYVRQKYPDKKLLFVIKQLIYDAGEIGILTDEHSLGDEVAESIMSEFGAFAEVYPFDYAPKDGVTVDMEENSLIIHGKWKLEKFSPGYDMHGYEVSEMQFYGLKYGGFEKIRIKDCRCGKNKLTLSQK